MKTEKLYQLEVDELEKLFDECEKEAERLDCTVDYYIAEFL